MSERYQIEMHDGPNVVVVAKCELSVAAADMVKTANLNLIHENKNGRYKLRDLVRNEVI